MRSLGFFCHPEEAAAAFSLPPSGPKGDIFAVYSFFAAPLFRSGTGEGKK